ncbi:MAG: cobalt ECF transporter T component CbiQ [Propionibacteriaceae bacterium]|jgi:cobalt/nickel transport system permease protein|nr:cobalt ECF transporter T component CbiQ [Propionibacteriaceae bacterium]
MPDIGARVHELRALENLAAGRTVIHRLHPLVKLIYTLVFIVFVVSCSRYSFAGLTIYLFFPFVMMAIAELPYKLMLSRVLIALPFCLFGGISNVIFDRGPAFTIGSVTVSLGMVSLATILVKMYLSVMAVLILVATTPFIDLTTQLRRLRVPTIFVMVFEMTFRYIAVLLEEVHSMMTAYRLRSGNRKALEMKHMGSFLGQLVLRSFDRAERVHAAMSCRGYSLHEIPRAPRKLGGVDLFALALVCLPTVLLRFIVIG